MKLPDLHFFSSRSTIGKCTAIGLRFFREKQTKETKARERERMYKYCARRNDIYHFTAIVTIDVHLI